VEQPEAAPGVTSQCLDHVNTMMLRGSMFGIAGAAVLALLLGNSVPAGRRALWFAVVTTATTASFLAALVYHRRRQHRVLTRWPAGFVTTVTNALAWASIAWIAFPDATHGALRAVILLFCLATSASGIVSAGASRARFYAYQIPLIVPLSITYFASPDHVTKLLGVAFPIYLVGMSAMHHEVHKVVTSEMRLRGELRDANERLTLVALHDSLTGLRSRAAFRETLDSALSQSSRSGEIIGLLFFDIDRFKCINDAFGHGAGDAVLIEVAERVRPLIRAHDCLARLGGDEYALLLRNLDRPDHAVEVALRVSAEFVRPAQIDGRDVAIELSIGVATTQHGSHDAAELLQEADTAQYRAKRIAGTNVVVFDAALRTQLRKAATAASELHQAVERGEITAFFQPEIDLNTGAVVGAEALARWRHPRNGILTAGAFLETARDLKLIDTIDQGIFVDAMHARMMLRDRGIVGDDFRIWVNVVGSRLKIERFERLREFLAENNCPVHHFGIEVTEQQVLDDIDSAAACLAAASAAGLAVALDDFGTGSSSLSLVRDLPIDVLKIDQRFVRDVALNRADEAIIDAIITLGRRLDVRVTAEGVETNDHAQTLRRLGCHYAQGFLYAPALPFEDLATMIRRCAPSQLVAGPAQ
jgi:diguanylate cyclase (GGDEF)-like protein